MFKSMTLKRPGKDERQKLVLLGLVELYLELGKPIGSSTLRENGFDHLSSATIRNYFSKLEEEGFLKQQHSSGGRVPTEAAYKLYAETYLDRPQITEKEADALRAALSESTREVAIYLQKAAECLAKETRCAVFLSSPRFDQDFILDLKLVEIDAQRVLCVLLTDFGTVRTEMLFAGHKAASIDLKAVEASLQARICSGAKAPIRPEEEQLANRFYKEIMLRHIVAYSNFSAEEIYKTGFANLLEYPDFNHAAALASGLALFENEKDLRKLLKTACDQKELSCLFSSDLEGLGTQLHGCCLLTIPYQIHQTIAGAIVILGPNRLPYRRLFGILTQAAEVISETLTRSLYKFKITFRKAAPTHIELGSKPHLFLSQTQSLLTDKQGDA